jgi:secreted trypsin-like serine protease
LDRETIERMSQAAAAFAGVLAGDDRRAYMQYYIGALNLADQAVGGEGQGIGAELAHVLARDSVAAEPLAGDLRAAVDVEATSLLYSDARWIDNALYLIEADTRIVGGVETNDFPDCVAIGSQGQWCCTGTLVSSNVVVSAGHCVRRQCMQRIFTGPQVGREDDGRVVPVASAVMHPEYEPARAPFNDIAVLILSEDIDDVSPRSIAPADGLQDAATVRLVGYGATDVIGGSGYGRRRVVDVPLASDSLPVGQRPDIEFAAGRPLLEKDSCRGDSGGPAYLEVDDQWYLAGATSRAVPGRRTCGDGGIYSRVPVFAHWIRSVDGGHWSV